MPKPNPRVIPACGDKDTHSDHLFFKLGEARYCFGRSFPDPAAEVKVMPIYTMALRVTDETWPIAYAIFGEGFKHLVDTTSDVIYYVVLNAFDDATGVSGNIWLTSAQFNRRYRFSPDAKEEKGRFKRVQTRSKNELDRMETYAPGC